MSRYSSGDVVRVIGSAIAEKDNIGRSGVINDVYSHLGEGEYYNVVFTNKPGDKDVVREEDIMKIDEDKTDKLDGINGITVRVGGFMMALSYIPQIFKILSTQNVEGISLMFLVMVSAAVATFVFDGYVIYRKTGSRKTMIAQLLNFVPALITIALIMIYR